MLKLLNLGLIGMSKRVAKSSTRRFWTKREEEFLLGCMKDLFHQDTKWKLDYEQLREDSMESVRRKSYMPSLELI